MSKNTYTDKIKVSPGEGYMVARLDVLDHIAMTYRVLAGEHDDPKPWLETADLVEEWANATANVDGGEEHGA